jgi:Ca-activated chloride channel family protein
MKERNPWKQSTYSLHVQGRPRSAIELQGVTGDVLFRKSIDVGATRALKNNSALRYLWARHRITVKQPLPLPHGVSDYAVGNRTFAKAKANCYLAPSGVGSSDLQKNQYLKEEAIECRKDYDAVEPEVSHTSAQQVFIKLGDVNVTEGLSKQAVQKLLEEEIRSIMDCYKKASGGGTLSSKEFVVTLTVDPTGRITRVHMDNNKIKNSSLENCIINHLKKLNFPAPKKGKSVEVTITFGLNA